VPFFAEFAPDFPPFFAVGFFLAFDDLAFLPLLEFCFLLAIFGS
jgi:hypothetical protein